jgi:methyl-accepting chemotaxis protein
MKFVTIKSETSLADLSREVFEIKGAKAAAAAKRAQAALREANPHLADVNKVPAGTLVIVPDVPGTKEAPAQSVGDVSAEMITRLRSALAAAKKMIEESAESQLQDADATLSLAKDPELGRLAKQTPELKERMSRMIEQAKTQSKQVAEDKKTQLEAVKQLEKDLASMSPE